MATVPFRLKGLGFVVLSQESNAGQQRLQYQCFCRTGSNNVASRIIAMLELPCKKDTCLALGSLTQASAITHLADQVARTDNTQSAPTVRAAPQLRCGRVSSMSAFSDLT